MLLMAFLYLILPLGQAVLFIKIQLQIGIWGGLGDLLNYLSSILAYHWMLSNIILGAKIPRLQRSLPYDRRIRFHIYFSLGTVPAVIYHGIYKMTLGYQMNIVSIVLGAGLSLFLAAALLWIPVPGFKKIRLVLLQSLRGPVSRNYDRNKTIHSLGVLGLTFLILIHLLQSGLFQDVPLWSKTGYLLLYLSGLILFILSKTSFFRREAQVVSVSNRAGIVILTLKTDVHSSFKNGQFAFLQLNDQKSKHRQHPFSYLTGETSHGEGEHIVQFAARIVGSFTNELGSLKPCDQIFLRNGFGNFRPENESKICLIGSGIGIVPLISLMEEFYETGDSRNVEVFFSVNSREEIPRLTALQTLSSEMENLNLHLLVYEEDQRLYSYDYFKERLAVPNDYSYYLCSSPRVRSAVLAVLKTMGIKRNHIHFESFSFA